jgi:Lhr-like helicase
VAAPAAAGDDANCVAVRGDTPPAERQKIPPEPEILITTPESLNRCRRRRGARG